MHGAACILRRSSSKRSESALAFLCANGALEYQAEVLCPKQLAGVPCGSMMHEGLKGGAVRKPVWRCSRHGCNGVRSVKANIMFFVYKDSQGRFYSRLELHKILELIWSWLYSTQTQAQVCFNVGVSDRTVCDWYKCDTQR